MHVLGIDAGGTKTVCLLADAHGRIIAEARGRGANLQVSGELEVEKVLHEVMDAVLTDAVLTDATLTDTALTVAAPTNTAPQDRDIRPAAVCLGIAGVDRPRDAGTVRAIMRRIGFKTTALIVNDALVALTAGVGDGPGVVIVAGTGSIAYGRDARGRAARAGGWGYLLGDEGGGYWIGRAALTAVVRAYDGRGPATTMTDLVLAHLQLATPAELVRAIYDDSLHAQTIAGFARVVEAAFDRGDALAADILQRAANELATAAASVITRLEMRGDDFTLVFAGGILRSMPALAADVGAQLLDVAPRCVIHVLDVEPAVGAVRLALSAARGEAHLPTYI